VPALIRINTVPGARPLSSDPIRSRPGVPSALFVTSPTDPAQPRVALVEDDVALRLALTRLLRFAHFDVDPFGSAEAFLAAAGPYACLVLDLQLPGLSGLELAEHLQAGGDRTPLVFITGSGEHLIREVKRRTGFPCLAKPVDEAALLMAIATALLRG
jgi:FixJ family two-component response regulator